MEVCNIGDIVRWDGILFEVRYTQGLGGGAAQTACPRGLRDPEKEE